MFCKDVSQCVQRRRELYFLSHLCLLLATQMILRYLSCQVVLAKICHAEDFESQTLKDQVMEGYCIALSYQ